MAKEEPTLQQKFQKAVEYVRKWKPTKPIPPVRKLICYGLYKQVTIGDNSEAQPWAVQFEARQKWNAWEACKGNAKEQCMQDYIDEVERLKTEFGPCVSLNIALAQAAAISDCRTVQRTCSSDAACTAGLSSSFGSFDNRVSACGSLPYAACAS
eukprot:TRINITY_DN4510_c0_g1_i2.p1 TRINITY_DN4510_c0_g1~~TRINITY_DN4510_c0_g1_i2.p1  ORF type:complete len:179 (-),score=33.95 TRINITY_DN4510_c0_g1_i2:358-819(-)